jgi:hypothetical protein
MKTATKWILVFLLLVVLVGCSPSGEGGGSSGSTAKSYSLAEGGSVRNMTTGDYWKYTGTTIGQQGSSRVTADLNFELSYASGGYTQYSSNPIIISASTLVMKNNGVIVFQGTSQEYYVNSGGIDYHVMEQGEDDLFYAVNQLNGEPNIPAQVINNGSYSSAYTFDTCGTFTGYSCINPTTIANVTATYTLLGTETVSTSIGNFESYKIRMTTTQTSINTNAFPNMSGTSTIWYYPPLGMVKQTATTSSSDYSPPIIQEFTVTLNTTNNSRYSRGQNRVDFMNPFVILKMINPANNFE